MRIKVLVAKSLLVALPLALIPALANSATKIIPGTKCKVLNQKVPYQDKTYTCKKSGNKLVWNKGIAIKPTSTSEPTSANVDNWQKAIEDIRNYKVKSGLEIPKVLLKYSSNSDPDDIRRLNEAMSKPLAFWSQFESGIPDVNVFLYSEKDLDWFLSMWTQYKMGDGAIDFWKRSGDFGGGAVLVDTLGNPSVWFKNLTTSDFQSEPTDYYFHEVTHFYQKKMFGSQEAPCWFLEGSAMLVGYANGFESSIQNNSYARFNRNLKIVSLNAYIESLPGSKGEKLLDLVSRSHNDIICNTKEPLLGYGLGWLVSEKIVADYSWSHFIDFMRRSGQQSWKLAFKETFGVEHKEFYSNALVPYLLRVLA